MAGLGSTSFATSHNAATGTGAGAAIDLLGAVSPLAPPVMLVFISATATYAIEGSHDNVNWWVAVSGLTATDARDIPIGVRYWRTNISANSGTVTSQVGAFPNGHGSVIVPARVGSPSA